MSSHGEMSMIRRVAVIGAGPGGLAAAKYLAAEKTFSQIEVFDQRPAIGGVWLATPEQTIEPGFSVPRTQPTLTSNEPFWDEKSRQFQFLSPIYDQLETNIPYSLMEYGDARFPRKSSLFPSHGVVRAYLERYADDVRSLLRLETQVLDVRPVEGTRWSVSTRNVASGVVQAQLFDAVVVANGHYNDPYVPDIPGIREWQARFPGSISHSKYYRKPEDFKDKKVIVVGYSASGMDIASQIVSFSRQPLLISKKEISEPIDPKGTLNFLPQITNFHPSTRSVQFANNHVESAVDAIVFCTGYMYSFPFLSNLTPPLITTGVRVHNLYQHMFWTPNPTLAFIGLPQRIVPFPLSECQAAVIARVLSHRLELPTRQEMVDWEAALLAKRGDTKAFHNMGFPADADYINLLHGWALSARSAPALEERGKGKVPPWWDEETRWVRERTAGIKEASRKLGSERVKVKSLEELGFDYRKWKEEQSRVQAVL